MSAAHAPARCPRHPAGPWGLRRPSSAWSLRAAPAPAAQRMPPWGARQEAPSSAPARGLGARAEVGRLHRTWRERPQFTTSSSRGRYCCVDLDPCSGTFRLGGVGVGTDSTELRPHRTAMIWPSGGGVAAPATPPDPSVHLDRGLVFRSWSARGLFTWAHSTQWSVERGTRKAEVGTQPSLTGTRRPIQGRGSWGQTPRKVC